MGSVVAQILSKSSPIVYRLAEVPGDYEIVNDFLDEEQVDRSEIELAWPTIMALEEDELVGILGTFSDDAAIVAGPLVTKSDRHRGIMALRMVEVYDTVLRNAGISTYTAYAPRENQRFLTLMERVPGFECIAENADGKLFARRL